ncbi:MAG: GntR family transcriptional regulator [Paracoccaceae bacterium]|nr:GntR family transcriptional regulator [Paracoccaceae bacterium]
METDQTALPKYVQTAELLIREIAAGRLADGARMKPERAMAVELGVSVGTLRKALGDLTEKGLLERVQGSGNYVRHRPEAAGVYAFFRLELVEGGGLPTAEVLSVERTLKPDDLPAFGRSDSGHRIRRLRRLSGKPAAMEEIWLDGVWADVLMPADLSESLYLFYREELGLWIARAEDSVGLGVAPKWRAPDFGLAAGSPCGFIERWGRTPEGEVAEYSRTWFDPGVARYVARIR